MADYDDLDDGIFAPIYSLLVIAGVFGWLWWRGHLADAAAWGGASFLFLVYVVISLMVFPTIRDQSALNPANVFWNLRGHKRSFLLYLFLPGWFVGRSVARLFGVEQLYS